MGKWYYLATNIWGRDRAFQSGNGWSVVAYETEELRDEIYNCTSYVDTGCTIPTERDIDGIMGTKKWVVSCGQLDDGGYIVVA